MSWLPDWLTGYDAKNAAAAAEADAKLRAINDAKIAAGYYTPEQAAQIQHDYATQDATAPMNEAAQRAEISTAFDQGWAEGRQNVSNAISGTLNKIIADPLRAVIGGLPWWLWLAAIVFIVWRFGLWKPLKGIITK